MFWVGPLNFTFPICAGTEKIFPSIICFRRLFAALEPLL